MTGRNDHTLETLASQLDLRINTVWAYKRKVAIRIAHLEKHGKKPTVSGWEDVILLPPPARKMGKSHVPISGQSS